MGSGSPVFRQLPLVQVREGSSQSFIPSGDPEVAARKLRVRCLLREFAASGGESQKKGMQMLGARCDHDRIS